MYISLWYITRYVTTISCTTPWWNFDTAIICPTSKSRHTLVISNAISFTFATLFSQSTTIWGTSATWKIRSLSKYKTHQVEMNETSNLLITRLLSFHLKCLYYGCSVQLGISFYLGHWQCYNPHFSCILEMYVFVC